MKILVACNNLLIGGVQKALVNLLRELVQEHDVTLLLLNSEGQYLSLVPRSITILSASSSMRHLATSDADARSCVNRWVARSALAVVARTAGSHRAIRLCLLAQRQVPGDYDVAISFMHGARRSALAGGCPELVLSKVKARRKIYFVHADFENGGFDTPYNRRMMAKYDVVAAVSEGVRLSIVRQYEELGAKTFTVHNCVDRAELRRLSEEEVVPYPNRMMNVLSVARLGPEKGIERALRAIAYMRGRGCAVHYHVIGDGVRRRELCALSEQLAIGGAVTFYGALTNPYPHMRRADLLLVPSFHEAAPLVIDEALALGLPVLSTRTVSADEMLADLGWVCENSQEGINTGLEALCLDPSRLEAASRRLWNTQRSNTGALSELYAAVGASSGPTLGGLTSEDHPQ